MIDQINVTVSEAPPINVAVAPPAQINVTLSQQQEAPPGIGAIEQINVTVTQGAPINVTFSQQQGLPGRPGTGTLPDGVTFETWALVDGAQTFTLPSPAGSGLLCINGLRQSAGIYSVSGSLLTLPAALQVLAGDLISFDYYAIH